MNPVIELPGVPLRIRRHLPFFSFGEAEGYFMEHIAKGLIHISPADWNRGFSLGETVAMAVLKIFKAYPVQPGEVIELEADLSAFPYFVREYRINGAPEVFRVGFYSVFEAVSRIALECPQLIPALGRLVDSWTAESLESRALACLQAEPARPGDSAPMAAPCFGDLIEAEHRKGAGNVA